MLNLLIILANGRWDITRCLKGRLWSQDPMQKQGMKCCSGEIHFVCLLWMVRGGAVGCGTALQATSSIPDGVLDINLPAVLWPWGVDSASNSNKYQEYFQGGKADLCAELTTLPPSCAECLKICKSQPPGTLNPLNPELNPICYLLALLTHHFLHFSRIRVKSLTIRLLMSYIYIYIYIYI